jgi:hypothetical protein
MNHLAEFVFIDPISDGAGERRRGEAAGSAEEAFARREATSFHAEGLAAETAKGGCEGL